MVLNSRIWKRKEKNGKTVNLSFHKNEKQSRTRINIPFPFIEINRTELNDSFHYYCNTEWDLPEENRIMTSKITSPNFRTFRKGCNANMLIFKDPTVPALNSGSHELFKITLSDSPSDAFECLVSCIYFFRWFFQLAHDFSTIPIFFPMATWSMRQDLLLITFQIKFSRQQFVLVDF